MLKALELHGFKSFADKTRFEFPPGITVVVGPNGSGKSNVVDAIKWVLGEQSAKSLRGKDMADVIFKGSGESGRKPMNTAEATLVFDNADRRLPLDAPEVHITRRVYRSGEGEYLINRQPARLKDIRDMFRGTGVGVDAYSLIEQGKVDRLLQASAKDRRAMFEEAAGISRFKAKKVEAQRRLERVEQNLLRLGDIVEEVENRLKTVRSQAGKARRYREYSERLQQLRTQIALVDWRRLTERLSQVEAELATAVESIDAADSEAQRLEALQLELEAAVATAAEELRNGENQLAFARQHIAQQQSTIDHERSRSAELEDEMRLHRRNLLAMSDKAGDVRQRLQETKAEAAAAQAAQQAAAEELARRELALATLVKEHEEAHLAAAARRSEHVTQLQRAASLASQVQAAEAQQAALEQAASQYESELAEATAEEHALSNELESVRQSEEALAQQLAAHQAELETAQNELAENRNLYASRADDLAQLQTRRRGVAERAAVLEEFERTLEGIGAGVRQVLGWIRHAESRSQNAVTTPLVRGVVADFVQVAVEHAAAIDVALGEAAQAVVVDGGMTAVRAAAQKAGDLAGRVVFLPLRDDADDAAAASLENTTYAPQHPLFNLSADLPLAPAERRIAAPETTSSHESRTPGFIAIELTAEMVRGVGIVGRADKLVECAAECRPLVARLLARTFVVRSLDDALLLRERAPQGTRLVSLEGELVDEHGALAIGPRQSATSLVSRRSQLRASRLDLAVLDQQVADAQRETAHLKREIERHEESVRQLQAAGLQLQQQTADQRARVQNLEQRVEQTRRRVVVTQQALTDARQRCSGIEATLEQTTQQLALAQTAAATVQSAIASQEHELAELDARRQQAAGEVTAAKVHLARCEQRLESLRLRLSQFEDDQRERERAVAQVQDQLRQACQRQEASQLSILEASAQIAKLALHQEWLASQMVECLARRDEASRERSAVSDELTALRRRALKLRDKEHQLQLAAEQVRHEMRTLADRMREDYGIDLAAASAQPSEQEAEQRAAVEEEIETLRRKINQIGAINLDALEELDELEQRYASLSGQYQDLTEAKQSLERIIHRINADSRRLFLETLEAIRVNFQALYRKAFGGGKADIVLEEGVDVLECGVEIVATPPGKPSFNNSLLSGGERALTAVALLLAIFQFRPSPFCVLDEVDAPFDEANIGRFIDVLHDFLSWTRFVIVTHSKKTMTAATTLYGVTMQESGVSKRVSVRFEDVSDDGHIRGDALARSGNDEPAENAA